MDASSLLDGGISDAGHAIRERSVSIADLVSCSLERIEETAALNAYTAVYADQALVAAGAHQDLLDLGYDLGPLHGIPVALKDNIDVAGAPTTAGSAILRDSLATRDAWVTRALKRAGAIIVGKNNLHEFAWGGTTANPHFGRARNPWHCDRSPAGSSGGSGIAVATRTVFTSIGTDTGGSVRLPAAVNGVTGLRPTIGLISNEGIFPVAWTLDTAGPLAKSSHDCAVVLEVLEGDRLREGQALAVSADTLAELGCPLGGLRVGLIEGYSDTRVEPAVLNAFESAMATLESIGATMTSVKLSDMDALAESVVVLHAETSAVHARMLRERGAEYGADVRERIEAGSSLSAVDYIQAQRYRTHLQRQLTDAFRTVDALVTPTLPFTAPVIGRDTVRLAGEERELVTANMQFSALASLTGLPALSVPMGFDYVPLPIGLQIITPAGAERLALRIGHQFQTVTDFHMTAPPAGARCA
ncbi:MAG: amidase [Pseudonocardia sp.]|nr:amidase [Pseudonocardia sp.]